MGLYQQGIGGVTMLARSHDIGHILRDAGESRRTLLICSSQSLAAFTVTVVNSNVC